MFKKQMKTVVFFLLWVSFSTTGLSETWYPERDSRDKPNPIADQNAVTGGMISIFAGPYPKSLNAYLDYNSFTVEVFGALYETLLTLDSISLEYEPLLADKWAISDDKKSFTFHIDPNARWSDGSPVTAEDVKWSYEAIMAPENMTGVHKVSLERFYSPELLDKLTIRFTAKNVHWKNLMALSSFEILPHKAYSKMDFNKINFEFPVISGPYRLGEVNEGVYLTLERRDDWWQREQPRWKGFGNFQTMRFRFYGERENALEAFKKGLIDLFPIYTSRIWVKETSGPKYINNWIVKQKIYNHNPVGFQGFAMNMRKPPFDDLKVRRAMAMLLNRRKLNKTLMYNQYFLHRSYYEDLYTKENPCQNQLVEFDKEKARTLLADAGWMVNPKTGYLEKEGKKFSFRFLTRNASTEKFYSIYMEDLKDVGIEMVIDKKDWAAWARDMDEFNYQMTWAAWGSPFFKDPEGMWSSKEAERRSGNNITGFKNPRVDELIEKQKVIFDMEKRNDILREIDQIIFDACPYVLLWNINYTRLLYWNKFGNPGTVLSKYGTESSAYWYWWLDEDSLADLEDAMDNTQPLPRKASEVYFDKMFQKP
jgi:microcin C transport system substrate-binding protein